MEMLILRDPSTEQATEGSLYVDGLPECYTLEDPVRAVKIQNETAIPAGRYAITIDESPRFGRRMPHILNVPNFTGVRIHYGNTAADTDGCILVGWEKGIDFIGSSRLAFAHLFDEIETALDDGEQVWLTIKDASDE
jgi:hypothetical protein